MALTHGLPGLAAFVLGAALFAWGKLGGGDVKLLAVTFLWAGTGLAPVLLMVLGIAGLMLLLVHQRMGTVLHYLALRAASAVGRPGILPQALQTQKGLPYALAIAPAGLVLARAIAVDLTPREAAMDSFAAATDPARVAARSGTGAIDLAEIRRQLGATIERKSLGWKTFDSLELGMNPGELAVIAGRTGHGKSTAMLNVLIHWLETHTDQTFVLFQATRSRPTRWRSSWSPSSRAGTAGWGRRIRR